MSDRTARSKAGGATLIALIAPLMSRELGPAHTQFVLQLACFFCTFGVTILDFSQEVFVAGRASQKIYITCAFALGIHFVVAAAALVAEEQKQRSLREKFGLQRQVQVLIILAVAAGAPAGKGHQTGPGVVL